MPLEHAGTRGQVQRAMRRKGECLMARYQLQRWSVGHYAATATRPAFASVTLDGVAAHGFIRRHAEEHSEDVRVPLLPTDTASATGSQIIVRRAMRQSANRWRGRP